jgi:hypothetical protein
VPETVSAVVEAYGKVEALAETVPSVPTWRQRVDAPPRLEMTKLVVEAVPETVSAVVEAYGKVEAMEVEVAVK